MTRFAYSLFLSLAFATSAIAHGGEPHDHGAGSVAPASALASHRLESTSGELELVAVAEGHTLTIFLDRVATNEPIDGATIEVSGDGITPVQAKPVGDGVYLLAADWVDMPGTKALVFAVDAGSVSDLLNGTLEIAEPSMGHAASAATWGEILRSPIVWLVAGLALAVGFVSALGLRPLRHPLGAGAGQRAKVPASDRGVAQLRSTAEAILLTTILAAFVPSPTLAGPGHDQGGGHRHDGAATASTAAGNAPRKLAGGDVFMPKPSQRLLKVRTAIATKASGSSGTELVGTVIPDPSSAGAVQAPMDGLIELAGRGIAYVGQKVSAGEVLAVLSPTIPLADLGTLQQLTAEVEGKLIIAENKLARISRLAGVVTQREIDDTRTEIEALRKQKRVLTPKAAQLIELKAPVGGVIAAANVRPGQVVSARDTLFEIVDPDRLWIEAIGSEHHADSEIGEAHARHSPDGHWFKLVFAGRAPALRHQSLPLMFRLAEPHRGLAIGAAVQVIVQGARSAEGVILPEAAVVRASNGLPQVWTKVGAELFKPVPVKVVPLDGARTLVTAGLAEGSRVVVEGAELINQTR
jgi:RND family efflux transporter MFP subunit